MKGHKLNERTLGSQAFTKKRKRYFGQIHREKAELFAEHLKNIVTPNPDLDIEEETTEKTEEEAVMPKQIDE